MRRGLLAWSREEVSEATLDARLERCRAAMREARFDSLLLYTDFTRPCGVSYLTHFIPYWSRGVLLVYLETPSALFIHLSARGIPWMRETSNLETIVCTPHLGREAARQLTDVQPAVRRLGIVEPDTLPTGIADPLVENLGEVEWDDASAMFRSLRLHADETERALTRRAQVIASTALEAGIGASDESGAFLAAIERRARLEGAEDLSLLLAIDLRRDATLRQIEGKAPLGERFAVQVALAYKGSWVRMVRSCTRDSAPPASWIEAERWFEALLLGFGTGVRPDEVMQRADSAIPTAALHRWTIEACTGTAPFTVLAGSSISSPPALQRGSLAHCMARLDLPDGPWWAGATLLIDEEQGAPILKAGR